MTKKLRTLIAVLIFGGLLIAVCIKFIRRDINIDLNKAKQITGKVIDLGLTEKSSRVGGRTNLKSKIFYLQLNNTTETLASFRPEQDYSALLKNIGLGDTITVYYKPSQTNELNLDVYQIVKAGKIIQDYDSYNKNHRTMAWVTGIGGILMVGFGIYGYRKGWT